MDTKSEIVAELIELADNLDEQNYRDASEREMCKRFADELTRMAQDISEDSD